MLDAAREAKGFSGGRTREDLATDRMLVRALINAVQEIGEAAVRMTPQGRRRAPGVPWDEIVKMRNILVHVYWGIDLDKLWGTIRDDLPQLTSALEAALDGWDADSADENETPR